MNNKITARIVAVILFLPIWTFALFCLGCGIYILNNIFPNNLPAGVLLGLYGLWFVADVGILTYFYKVGQLKATEILKDKI